MNNIQDLHIETELLPLFDFTLNNFAKFEIVEILNSPLSSIDKIVHRQNIFKGFASNHGILKGYTYSLLYLNEVHYFLNDERIEDVTKKLFRYSIFGSNSGKIRYISKFNQMILFLYKLEQNIFLKLDLDQFPDKYKLQIERIINFLDQFELSKYENLVKKHKLKYRHVINLSKIINELKKTGKVNIFWKDLFLFEAYLSINLGILKNGFVFPTMKDKRLKIIQFYHPLIKDPIKNDIETESNVVVLNGPNMSGKSTLLKAVSLCVYFGHLGFAIPAGRGEIPFFNNFSVAISKKDDIINGYSHFMTEMVNLKQVVQNALKGKRCFAVFDELFSGTNVEDAFEICKTTITGLSKYDNSIFFISSHIQELKSVSNEMISNYYIDCELVDERPIFTYLLKKGWSNIKVGRILFEKEGLNRMLK